MITPRDFQTLSDKYRGLRLAIVGDFCLDRYLEIDPVRGEVSIETNLPVHNVIRVRSQPGGAGTILNNLVALGVSEIFAVGMSGLEGEGYELDQALRNKPGVRLDYFIRSGNRRTFTYTKPLLMHPGQEPVELSRLDMKNWAPPAAELQDQIAHSIQKLAGQVDGIIILDQVDVPETGVVTRRVLEAVREVSEHRPGLLILADSRRGLKDFPALSFKMNATELEVLTGTKANSSLTELHFQAQNMARRNNRVVCVTMAEKGLLGAEPGGASHHVPALPLRGPIDIVGAGDSVTANLACALAAGGSLKTALEVAAVASSIVIHQLGTTGTASPPQILELLQASA